MKNLKYIYGPVASWRLGRSLGIDPLSGKERLCTFDCTYCQLGVRVASPQGKSGFFTTERKNYVSAKDVIQELKSQAEVKVDYITFSGRGEPTLALNLGELIKAVKRARKEPVAVLTNSSLLDREAVRNDLAKADLVAVKLDAWNEESFNRINKPANPC